MYVHKCDFIALKNSLFILLANSFGFNFREKAIIYSHTKQPGSIAAQAYTMVYQEFLNEFLKENYVGRERDSLRAPNPTAYKTNR
jgi:hypothetical protein